jgi:DNA-binding beta-propeller fold protein YncE
MQKLNFNRANARRFLSKAFCAVATAALCSISAFPQAKKVEIGVTSTPDNSEVSLTLVQRFQQHQQKTKSPADRYDVTVNSPKSVNILDAKDKFYVHSLEGCRTSVYRLSDFEPLAVVNHTFDHKNQHLFSETAYLDYKFQTRKSSLNVFAGKPVESCFSHEGKYLWVTYYRRSYDPNAIDPSALCVIDTDADTIVRVMPTAPLPKMIACSPDSRTIAVTHWGDNTMALIDVSSHNPEAWKYLKNITIDRRLSFNFDETDTVKIDRDNNCGHCLRGTVFTPNNSFVLIGKMGGNGIAVIDVVKQKYLGTVAGMKQNLRHLLIKNGYIYCSINRTGFVQQASLDDFLAHIAKNTDKPFTAWKSVYVGEGARTIVAGPDGKYIFAAVNNKSKIAVVRTADMKVIAECAADSYPVGMDISEDGKTLIVTAQGKAGNGGNSVMIYSIKN